MNGYIKKQALMDYCSNQVTRTIDLNDIARFPIAEIYTKADLKAILVDLQLEIEEYKSDRLVDMERDEMARIFSELIQQKINALNGNIAETGKP